MSNIVRLETANEQGGAFHKCDGEPVFRHVLACVDNSPYSRDALAHAAAIASSMGARLTVIRVLEPSVEVQTPTDPVEWRMRHRVAEAELRDHALLFGGTTAETVVVDGPAAQRICDWVRENDVDLTVLGSGGESGWPFAGLGTTARRIIEAAQGSVLLAPAASEGHSQVHYRKVMTPLDGSSRAECALPISISIANAHKAEILLVHAAPNIDLTETGPLEPEAFSLRDQLRQRNERVAKSYLRKIQSWLPIGGAQSRIRVLASGDPRHALAKSAIDDNADLIVLSTTGMGGHGDISVGSVADYLINHADKPVLLVRSREWSPPRKRFDPANDQATRLPGGAMT